MQTDLGPGSPRLARYWDRRARDYDERMAGNERRLLATSRPWVCARATGRVLEVAAGTGLNLPHYSAAVELTVAEWSPAMLAATGERAHRLGRRVRLVRASAGALPFSDGEFDAVVCTFSLCCVPDERAALEEAVRVLRPGGDLLLADHVVATSWWLRAGQALVDVVSIPTQGEHYRRRPLEVVRELGLTVVDTEREHRGMIERVHARTPV